MNSAIEVRHLTKQYLGFALKDVSFQIPEGSVVGFIGENGAGKSTTIKVILDLIKRDGGEITLLGEPDGAKDETLKEQIGVVFDENCFPDYLNRRDVNRKYDDEQHACGGTDRTHSRRSDRTWCRIKRRGAVAQAAGHCAGTGEI